MQLLDRLVKSKYVVLIFAERITEANFDVTMFSLRGLDSSYSIAKVNGDGGALNITLNKAPINTGEFYIVYVPKSPGFITFIDGSALASSSWQLNLVLAEQSNLAQGIGVPITCAEDAVLGGNAMVPQPLRVESIINYTQFNRPAGVLGEIVVTFNALLDPSQIPDKSAFTIFAPGVPNETTAPPDQRHLGTWQNELSAQELTQLTQDLMFGAVLSITVEGSRLFLRHNYSNVQWAIIKYLPPQTNQLRSSENPWRYILPFSGIIKNDMGGDNCLPWYHANRVPTLENVSDPGKIDFAAIADYVNIYGLQEAIQVSNDDNNSATKINESRMNAELKAAATFLLNHIQISTWSGRALLIGSFNRTQLIIARYFLHNKRKPQAIIYDYEKILAWIDQASRNEANRERINCEQDKPDIFIDVEEIQYDVFSGLGYRGWLYDPGRYRVNQFTNSSYFSDNLFNQHTNYQIFDVLDYGTMLNGLY
jgi:hypothetical protein